MKRRDFRNEAAFPAQSASSRTQAIADRKIVFRDFILVHSLYETVAQRLIAQSRASCLLNRANKHWNAASSEAQHTPAMPVKTRLVNNNNQQSNR